MKEKNIKYKKTIFTLVLLLFIISIIIITCINTIFNNTNTNKDYPKIKIIDREITDEEISRIISTNIEDFKEYREYYIGTTNYFKNYNAVYTIMSRFKELSSQQKKYINEESINNFKLLETYILNNDNEIAISIYNELNNEEYSLTSNDFLNRFYSYVLSGIINYHSKDLYDCSKLKIERISKKAPTRCLYLY